MNICTDKVTDWMIRCKVINESEKELYQYALYSAILQIIPLLLAGGIGFCFGSMRCGIIMILPFIILRKYSGGFHAKRLRIKFVTVFVHISLYEVSLQEYIIFYYGCVSYKPDPIQPYRK